MPCCSSDEQLDPQAARFRSGQSRNEADDQWVKRRETGSSGQLSTQSPTMKRQSRLGAGARLNTLSREAPTSEGRSASAIGNCGMHFIVTSSQREPVGFFGEVLSTLWMPSFASVGRIQRRSCATLAHVLPDVISRSQRTNRVRWWAIWFAIAATIPSCSANDDRNAPSCGHCFSKKRSTDEVPIAHCTLTV